MSQNVNTTTFWGKVAFHPPTKITLLHRVHTVGPLRLMQVIHIPYSRFQTWRFRTVDSRSCFATNIQAKTYPKFFRLDFQDFDETFDEHVGNFVRLECQVSITEFWTLTEVIGPHFSAIRTRSSFFLAREDRWHSRWGYKKLTPSHSQRKFEAIQKSLENVLSFGGPGSSLATHPSRFPQESDISALVH